MRICMDTMWHRHVVVVKEHDRADLDALADRRTGRRKRVFEGGVENETRPALLLVVHLEDEALVLHHAWVIVPLVGLVEFQRIVFAGSIGEKKLIEEEVLLRHGARVTDRQRHVLHRRVANTAPDIDEGEAHLGQFLEVGFVEHTLPEVRIYVGVCKLHESAGRASGRVVAMDPWHGRGGLACAGVEVRIPRVADGVIEDEHSGSARSPFDQIADFGIVNLFDLVVVMEGRNLGRVDHQVETASVELGGG
mmetsp:Transcript_101793/g.287126  ORF Transcript_101793/g.287126 Transcript_101793/m.287126 type:complete len:250 (+) Transcript_101793:93-842(+)